MADLIRQAAQIYDEYEGNEEYIHIPDVQQMIENALNYPVLVAYNKVTNELEGIVTIKYHENDSKETMDPYYQKEGAKFFSITGVLVRQRENTLHKGIGSNLYSASILGIEQYAQEHRDEQMELNAVIDCTNLPSLYALINGTENLQARGLVGKNKELEAVLDAIYLVRDSEQHLVEAPTFVLKIDLEPKDIRQKNWHSEEEMLKSKNVFSYDVDIQQENYQNYETLLDTILRKIKKGKTFQITQMEDAGTGMVTYIGLGNNKIHIEDMQLERNGAQNIGRKRIPRRDVHRFVGPMPDITKGIIEGERDDR